MNTIILNVIGLLIMQVDRIAAVINDNIIRTFLGHDDTRVPNVIIGKSKSRLQALNDLV